MLTQKRLSIFIFLGLLACQNNSITATPTLSFAEKKENLYIESLEKGYNEIFLNEVFALIKKSHEHIKHDNTQFKEQSFTQYYNNAVNNLRIRKARTRIKKHLPLLTQIEKKYHVPKEYIVSLWAVESDFGQGVGNYNVINSLANLTFEGRREALFKKEFFASLEILSTESISPKDFKGSWAGAIGQCQFLPSTYLAHAVDFNQDGKKDIWHNKADILASMANYLSSLNWDINIPWGYEVTSDFGMELKQLSKTEKHSLKSLIRKYSISKLNKQNFSTYELQQNVGVLAYDSRFFITFKNFDIIKIWNNSSYFALTIGLLASKL